MGSEKERSPYAGRWIASLGDRIIGQGGTPRQALQAAKASRFKETPKISYVPADHPLTIHPIIEDIAAILPRDKSLYVVGGAVRNALLGLPVHELDFSIPEGAIPFSRLVADAFSGDFYPLDTDRDYGRVILPQMDRTRLVLDFAAYQGSDLDQDLKNRDFTINAMAVDVRNPQQVYDPLGGASDLHSRQLRACSQGSFLADPVRILRAIRFAIQFDLKTTPDTRDLMHAAVSHLNSVTAERLRDEVLQLLSGNKTSTVLRALDYLNAIPILFPELPRLKGLAQSPPHVLDAWDHSLDVLSRLQDVIDVLKPGYDPETTTSLSLGVISHKLGRFRPQFNEHLSSRLTINRQVKPLLFLAALYHDSGKPDTRNMDVDGRIRFIEHENVGGEIIVARGRAMLLSKLEIERLRIIVLNHMRPLWLTQTRRSPSRRAIYRFFKDCGPAGVDVCLLSLADTLATYGPTLPAELWTEQVNVVRQLLESWWQEQDQVISPPALINGDDLMKEFGLRPGMLIGRLLSDIREAQAEGKVNNRRQALEFAADFLANSDRGD